MTEETVGSAADEAAKLFGAAEEWLRDRVGPMAGAAKHQGPECLICPVCQLLHVLRTARPEVFEHLVDATGSLLLAVKAAVDASERSWARRRTPAPVERIDIT